jgi:hypothetical protein
MLGIGGHPYVCRTAQEHPACGQNDRLLAGIIHRAECARVALLSFDVDPSRLQGQLAAASAAACESASKAIPTRVARGNASRAISTRMWGVSRLHTDKAAAQHLRLELRARRERPCHDCAAEQLYELAPPHSIAVAMPRW